MSNELPEPWAAALAPKGIHSYRDMGAAAGIAHETARRLLTGGATSAATVNKVADALFGGDRTKVWSLYGEPLGDHGPWELPPEASLLNEEQRKAVLAVVRAMLPPAAQGGERDDKSPRGPQPGPTRLRPVEALEVDEAAHDEEHTIEEEQEGDEFP